MKHVTHKRMRKISAFLSILIILIQVYLSLKLKTIKFKLFQTLLAIANTVRAN